MDSVQKTLPEWMNDERYLSLICMDADDIERAGDAYGAPDPRPTRARKTSRSGHRHARRPSAKMLVHKIEEIEGVKVPLGKLDISFYRDDFCDPYVPLRSIPPTSRLASTA